MGSELKWQYSKGKGEELKKFIQNSINPIIETDIKDKKVSMSQYIIMERLVGINGEIMARMWLKAFF